MSKKLLKNISLILFFTLAFGIFASYKLNLRLHAASTTIQNDVFWKDTSGNPIYSQGGGIFKFGNTYYWYGVKYNGAVSYYNNPTKKNSDSSFNAVTCYSSTDLVNWNFESNIVTSNTAGFVGTTWIGRLGVVFNSSTKKYVLISQYQGPNGNGEVFATCSTPNGNFVYDHVQTVITNVVNNTTGDQTVFTDTDGKSYLICSNSSGRSHLYVAPIRTSDSLNIEPATNIYNSSTGGREGNCMFKYNGVYYFCSSDLHGWNSSQCYVISANNILGTYSSESVMAGSSSDFCHVSQTGFFTTIGGTDGTTVIFCGDRWSDFAGNGPGYNQWCPLTFNGSTPTFKSLSQWTLNAASGTWSVGGGNNYALNPSYEADRVSTTVPAGWSTWTNLTGATPNSNISGGHTGNWSWQLSYTSAYQGSIYQNITGLQNGTYTLTAWVQSSGGQSTAQIFVKNYGGSEVDYPITSSISSWKQISIPNINITNGTCQIGMYSSANANNWCKVDDFSLVKN